VNYGAPSPRQSEIRVNASFGEKTNVHIEQKIERRLSFNEE